MLVSLHNFEFACVRVPVHVSCVVMVVCVFVCLPDCDFVCALLSECISVLEWVGVFVYVFG